MRKSKKRKTLRSQDVETLSLLLSNFFFFFLSVLVNLEDASSNTVYLVLRASSSSRSKIHFVVDFSYQTLFFLLSNESTSSRSERRGCFLVYSWIFSSTSSALSYLNCYFILIVIRWFYFSRVSSLLSWFFHSNTIINVFIDFSLRYRLLLYRKPARKRNDDGTDFYYRIDSLTRAEVIRKGWTRKMRCTLGANFFFLLPSLSS